MSTVNELLKQLMDFHAYDLLHRDAALALTIAPENTKAYYWLIRSYQKQHMDEMAAGELAAAKQKLPEDEYQNYSTHSNDKINVVASCDFRVTFIQLLCDLIFF